MAISSKILNSAPKLGSSLASATSELGKLCGSSVLSTVDKVPRASPKTRTKDSREEFGTGAKKKAASATVAEADIQLVLGVPTTDEEKASIAQKRRKRPRQQNERESERAKEAKTQDCETG